MPLWGIAQIPVQPERDIQALIIEEEALLNNILDLSTRLQELRESLPSSNGKEFGEGIPGITLFPCKDSINFLASQLETLRASNTVLIQQNQLLGSQIQTLNVQIKGLEDEIDSLINVNQGLTSTIDGLNRDLRYEKAQNRQLREENNQQRDTIIFVREALENAEDEVDRMRNKNRELADSVRKISSERDSLKMEVADLNPNKGGFKNFAVGINMLPFEFAGHPIPIGGTGTGKGWSRLTLSNFSVSLYGKIGFFVGHSVKVDSTLPTVSYTTEETLIRLKGLSANSNSYALGQVLSQANLSILNFGAYARLPIGRNSGWFKMYFMAGLSYIRGTWWDVYEGDVDDFLVPFSQTEDGISLYALDQESVTTFSPIVGFASTFTFWNVAGINLEAGYMKEFEQGFISMGLHFRLDGNPIWSIPE